MSMHHCQLRFKILRDFKWILKFGIGLEVYLYSCAKTFKCFYSMVIKPFTVGDSIPRSTDFVFHVLPPSAPHLDLGGLSPMLQCGSPTASPSFARRRIYGDKQNTHQYGYGPRPIQAPPPLSREQSGGSLLGPGIPYIIKSPVNPKMTPLVEIYSSLIPYSSFLPPPPSQATKLSPFLPYSLLSNPLPFQQPSHPSPMHLRLPGTLVYFQSPGG